MHIKWSMTPEEPGGLPGSNKIDPQAMVYPSITWHLASPLLQGCQGDMQWPCDCRVQICTPMKGIVRLSGACKA